ncbi:MAG TPA: type II toxin-antitoxin system CcdA family antitoxin [Pseudomonas sp.]|nr:type II toxin-antitoxin system CcdA family antitoxin [Pseudomonas sp.]
MRSLFDTQAKKKPIKVSINSDLLAKARALQVNLSATFEAALEEQVRATLREAWKRDNQAAIKAYNRMVEARGTFGDSAREF